MDRYTRHLYFLLTILLATFFASSVRASPQSAQNQFEESIGYEFFEIGAVTRAYTRLLNHPENTKQEILPVIRFGIKWENGLFMNFGNFGSRGNGVGYNFYYTDDWEFDVLAHLGINAIEIGDPANESDFRLGLRATRYSEDSVFRVIASPIGINAEEGNGFYWGAWYAKNWLIRNWNLHFIFGASYFSQEILEPRYTSFIFEGEEVVGVYRPGSGGALEFEVGASYALTRDWVFEVSAGQTLFSDAIYDSPAVQRRGQTILRVGVMYVF